MTEAHPLRTSPEISDLAKALGIPPRALARILLDEGATTKDAEEALRRILKHRAYITKSIRSPGAFFRGVLRNVHDDHAAPPRCPTAASPPPSGVNNPPPSSFGRAYLRALRLLADGCDTLEALGILQRDFPEAPESLIQNALALATSLWRPQRSHSP